MERPQFVDSPYFVAEPGNWHLKPGAPDDVVREFKQWMDAYNSANNGQPCELSVFEILPEDLED
jgi:hypothetical protein